MAKDTLGHGSAKGYEMPSGKKVPAEHSKTFSPGRWNNKNQLKSQDNWKSPSNLGFTEK